jgi:aldehyde:ferredoxin oxidoreductase
MPEFGYAGAILEVDLSRKHTVSLPTDEYADRFIGGRGLAAKLYWDNVSPQTKALDSGNRLIFATGPLAGFPRLAGSRWKICGKSAAMEPQTFSYCNLGGSFGAFIKFAGYDAIAIQGSSDKPVYLFVRDGIPEIRDASFLWGKDAIETQEIIKAELGKRVRVASIGPAGENLVSFTTVLADENSSGGSGFGSVMGSKKLKAIALVGNNKPVAAQPERLSQLADYIYQLRGHHLDGPNKWTHEGRTKRRACYGCLGGCIRQYYETTAGKEVKFYCQAADMYEEAAIKYYGAWNEAIVQATDLCNRYSLDTFALESMIIWLARCYEKGLLGEEETGLPLSKLGSAEFIEILVRKISLREGFGDTLAEGTIKAAELVGRGAGELIGDSITTMANDRAMYDPRLFIINALHYATEPRKPIQELHEISRIVLPWIGAWVGSSQLSGLLSSEDITDIADKFWGSRVAGDLSTYEGKALAAKKTQDRTSSKESLVLCDSHWPITWIKSSDKHVGDPTVEAQLFSAVTGRETDEEGLNKIGERIFNLQRAIRMREGWGGRHGDRLLDAFHDIPIQDERFNPDCLVPGKDGKPVSRKGAVVERDKFEELKSEYYALRGWDVASGFQTRTKLQELGLTDIADDLMKRGLLK